MIQVTRAAPIVYFVWVLPILFISFAPTFGWSDHWPYCLAVAALTLTWRSGISFDPQARILRQWNGPLFPLLKEDSPLDDYAIVSVMDVRVENFRRNSLVRNRSYVSGLGLKLQPRMAPHLDPDDLPPVLHLASYSMSNAKTAVEDGRELARQLGFEFRSDI